MRDGEQREEEEEQDQGRAKILENEEQQDGGGDRAGYRHEVREAWDAESPKATLAKVAKALPMAREVSGQEEHHQNLDGFDGLKGSQVDLVVA